MLFRSGEYVAKAPPDGHTVFIGSNGNVMLGPMTMSKPPYQWDQVFQPVSMVSVATNVLTVRTSLPKNSEQRLCLGISSDELFLVESMLAQCLAFA